MKGKVKQTLFIVIRSIHVTRRVTILACSDSNDYINNINEDMIVTLSVST